MTFERDDDALTLKDWIPAILLAMVVCVLSILTYNHLGEDAFISFRYTRNLVAGHGLVYNPGEWVEGYSNLLWVLVLAPFEALGIRLHVAARLLSVGLHAGCVVAAWWLARRVLPAKVPRLLVWWLPVAIVLEPLLHYHSDRGLETVAWVALQFFALVLLVGGKSPWLVGLIAALFVWTRPEGIGFAIALAPAVAWSVRPNLLLPKPDRQTITRVIVYLVLPVAFFVAQLLLRKVAYGSFLPNTVVAKSGGMFASVREMLEFLFSHAFWPLLGLPGLLWAFLHPRTRVLAVASLGVVFGGLVFRLMAGDLLNTGFRYLLPVMLPLLVGYWLLIVQLAMVICRGAATLHHKVTVPLLACILLIPVPVMPVVLEPGSLYRGNTNAPRSRLLNRLAEPTTWNISERWQWYFSDPVYINTDVGRWVAENLPPEAVLAADQMGQFGFHTDHVIIDVLGLTDAHIARHGFDLDYLVGRGVDYLVIDTTLDIPLWPRAWRLTPNVPQLRDHFATPEFREQYRRRWLLRSHVSYIANGFSVYISRNKDDGAPTEEIFLGVDEEEFDRLWRVK